jgi:putative ABC transport system substrate-binding protein
MLLSRPTRRRAFLIGGFLVPVAWSAAAQQQAGIARLGWLTAGDTIPTHYFDEAMRRLGWIEGRNIVVDRRVSGNDPEAQRRAAAELVAAKPDVLVAGGTADARALSAVMRTIPIIVINSADLVAAGLAKTLVRPGGNVTGTNTLGRELDGKRLELVRQLMPALARVSIVGNLALSPSQRIPAAEELGHQLGLKVTPRDATRPADLDEAVAAAAAAGDEALIVLFDPLTFEERQRVIAGAARLRLPAIYETREYVEDGGLISYGPPWSDNFVRAAALRSSGRRGMNWCSIRRPPPLSASQSRPPSLPASTR